MRLLRNSGRRAPRWPRTKALAVVAAATAALALPCRADEFVAFRSPTGNIGCEYFGSGIRCDVAGGIVPLPPTPKDCHLDWGQGYEMARTGSVNVVCAADTALGAGTVLKYGASWSRGGITCRSAITGMRCTNASGHGFSLARKETRRF